MGTGLALPLVMKKHAIAVSSLLILIVAAGCEKKSACENADVTSKISGNHGHTLDVPAEAVVRGIGGVYPLKGGDHEHIVNLSDADLAALNEGRSVTTRATSVESHTHEVAVRCTQR